MARTSRATRMDNRESLIEFWFRVQQFLRVRTRISRAAGLRSREYELLLAIKAVPAGRSSSVSLMAERLCLQQPVTAGLVKSLEIKGLLRAERSPRDRRSLALKLTQKGEKLLRRIVVQSVNGLQTEGPGISTALEKTLREPQHGDYFSPESLGLGKHRKRWKA